MIEKTKRNRARRKRQALTLKKGDAKTVSLKTEKHEKAKSRAARIKGKRMRRTAAGWRYL